jgi:hypothetical protein
VYLRTHRGFGEIRTRYWGDDLRAKFITWGGAPVRPAATAATSSTLPVIQTGVLPPAPLPQALPAVALPAAPTIDDGTSSGFDLQSTIDNIPSWIWYALGAGAIYFLFFKRK